MKEGSRGDEEIGEGSSETDESEGWDEENGNYSQKKRDKEVYDHEIWHF